MFRPAQTRPFRNQATAASASETRGTVRVTQVPPLPRDFLNRGTPLCAWRFKSKLEREFAVTSTMKGFIYGVAAVTVALLLGFGGGVMIADWLNHDTTALPSRVERVKAGQETAAVSETDGGGSGSAQELHAPLKPRRIVTEYINPVSTGTATDSSLSNVPTVPAQTLTLAQKGTPALISQRTPTAQTEIIREKLLLSLMNNAPAPAAQSAGRRLTGPKPGSRSLRWKRPGLRRGTRKSKIFFRSPALSQEGVKLGVRVDTVFRKRSTPGPRWARRSHFSDYLDFSSA